jgi:hypothetical protein
VTEAVTETDARFQLAARGYLLYGIVYWVGGLYLLWNGVGVMGGSEARRAGTLAFWAVAGLVPLLVVPYLLAARRRWFERWVLSRRDFARVVALLLAFRAWKVAGVALHPAGATVPAPWGGTVGFQVGAAVFLVVTVAALAAVARAGWAHEPSGTEA